MPQPADDAVINKLKDTIASVFCCYDKLVVHQFGFTILYLPVYLALDEISRAASLKRNDDWTIEFQSSKSTDTGTVRQLLQKTSAENLFLKKELHLGLSEVHHGGDGSPHVLSDEEVNKLIYKESVIIDRVPLWGVALVNNEKINKIRKKDSKDRLQKFWPHFESKLSLLKKGDFEDLRISLYPEGSTVYRLFQEYLRDNVPPVVAPVELDREFDDLFRKIVDVAITIQPWRAIADADGKYLDVELVYNHLDPPRPFTNLYGCKPTDLTSLPPLNFFFRCLSLYVQSKVEELYRAVNSEEELTRLARYYCRRKDPAARVVEIDSDQCCPCSNGEAECKDAMSHKTAIQVLNDSRIYFHHGGPLKERCKEETDSLERAIRDWEISEYYENGLKQELSKDTYKNWFPFECYKGPCSFAELRGFLDPLYSAAIIMNDKTGPFWKESHKNCPLLPQQPHALPFDQLLHGDDKKLELQCSQLKGIMHYCSAVLVKNVSNQSHCSCAYCVKQSWKVEWNWESTELLVKLKSRMFPELMSLHPTHGIPRIYAPPGVEDDLGYETTLARAFHHFLDDGRIHITAVKLGFVKRDGLKLVWLLVVYKHSGGISNTIAESNFAQDKLAGKILNGWHLEHASTMEPLRVFRKAGHDDLIVVDDRLRLNGGVIDYTPCDGDRLWVFTFRI